MADFFADWRAAEGRGEDRREDESRAACFMVMYVVRFRSVLQWKQPVVGRCCRVNSVTNEHSIERHH